GCPDRGAAGAAWPIGFPALALPAAARPAGTNLRREILSMTCVLLWLAPRPPQRVYCNSDRRARGTPLASGIPYSPNGTSTTAVPYSGLPSRSIGRNVHCRTDSTAAGTSFSDPVTGRTLSTRPWGSTIATTRTEPCRPPWYTGAVRRTGSGNARECVAWRGENPTSICVSCALASNCHRRTLSMAARRKGSGPDIGTARATVPSAAIVTFRITLPSTLARRACGG